MIGWIHFSGRGCWVRDPAYRAWLKLLVEQMRVRHRVRALRPDRLNRAQGEWRERLHDHWSDVAICEFEGRVESNLDDYLAHDAHVEEVRQLLRECLAIVHRASLVAPNAPASNPHDHTQAETIAELDDAGPRLERIGKSMLYLLSMADAEPSAHRHLQKR